MSDPIPAPQTHLKPLKRTLISLDDEKYWEYNKLKKETRFYRVKNPRWASLKINLDQAGENFAYLKSFAKYKSLHLTSIEFIESQVGFCVGHFKGEIRHLVKNSRYLKKLHFRAGVMKQRRFLEVTHWISGQKNLRELSIVPYWYNEEDEAEIEEWGPQKTEGVSNLLYKLSAQLKRLTLVGFIQNSFASEFDFSSMNKLEVFCIQAASRPNDCDGEPTEFSKVDLKILKKVLTLQNLKRLVLINELEITRPKFWINFSKMIVQVSKPLLIEVEIDCGSYDTKTGNLFKETLVSMPPGVKFRYKITDTPYFLSLPESIEIKTVPEWLRRQE